MQTKDHKMLAEFLTLQMGNTISPIYLKAFIWGSVSPDRNPFTYLHGIMKGEKFHGHNYENILPVMRRLFHSIERRNYWGIKEYYRLGKLIHYGADAFTFPHNRQFWGTLKEHVRYELKLHKKFTETLQKQKDFRQKGNSADSFCDMKILHKEYLRQAGTLENDCSYILRAAEILLLQEPARSWNTGIIHCERVTG